MLEILVHLSATIPDRYAQGISDVPGEVAFRVIDESSLPKNWSTLDPGDQIKTRSISDILFHSAWTSGSSGHGRK